jgi:GxxExxY protein
MCSEFALAGIRYETEKSLALEYKGLTLEAGLRIDLLVENELIVELKAVDKLLPIHRAQLLTYMKIAQTKTGLLLNFNSRILKDGMERLVL